jgi:hypothetical protein
MVFLSPMPVFFFPGPITGRLAAEYRLIASLLTANYREITKR